MLIYSTSKVNPLNAKIISDLKDIPEEYYENIINLINGFKYGTLPNGSIKMLKNNENLKASKEYKVNLICKNYGEIFDARDRINKFYITNFKMDNDCFQKIINNYEI